MQTAARDHPFHPVRSYLKGLQWDGVERLDCWLSDYLGVGDSDYSRAVGCRWMISAVARIRLKFSGADEVRRTTNWDAAVQLRWITGRCFGSGMARRRT